MFALSPAEPRPLNVIDGVAVIVALASMLIEHRADGDLHKFGANHANPTRAIASGL